MSDQEDPRRSPETAGSTDAADDDLMPRLRALADRTEHPADAYLFVLHGLEFARHHVPPQRWVEHDGRQHVDAVDLCWCLRDLAERKFRGAARERLGHWSITSCEDFGRIVNHLIDAGLVIGSPEGSVEDFSGVFDFEEEFGNSPTGVCTELPCVLDIPAPGPSEPGQREPPQFALRTLMKVTIVAAIVLGVIRWQTKWSGAIKFFGILCLLGVIWVPIILLTRHKRESRTEPRQARRPHHNSSTEN